MESLPPQQERVYLLLQQIEEKEKKASQYDTRCHALDLVVLDGSNLFFHSSQEEFYQLFYELYPKSKLIESPFREIHLLTQTIDN
jgi:hypothetical protein